jgi:K+-transporting ATPase KdpF subunit
MSAMVGLGAMVALALLVYLVAALLYPEKFS